MRRLILVAAALAVVCIDGRVETKSASRTSPRAPVGVIQTVVAGGVARSTAQAVTYPMDALRTLAQTRKGAKTLGDLGARVLVSGCFSTSAFAFPMGAIQFTMFGAVKR